MARIGGFSVIAIFWLYEERTSRFFDHYNRMAVDLERALGYTQYTTRPVATGYIPKAKVLNRVFFFVLTLLWVYAVFSVPLDR